MEINLTLEWSFSPPDFRMDTLQQPKSDLGGYFAMMDNLQRVFKI